ncbi:MAG: PspC domain-containing protein [Prevotella sp.]
MSTGKRLERSNDRLLGGVCAGIAETFDWDITAVRIAYVLLTLFTAFSGTLVYLLLWIIMPPKQ